MSQVRLRAAAAGATPRHNLNHPDPIENYNWVPTVRRLRALRGTAQERSAAASGRRVGGSRCALRRGGERRAGCGSIAGCRAVRAEVVGAVDLTRTEPEPHVHCEFNRLTIIVVKFIKFEICERSGLRGRSVRVRVCTA